MDLIRWFRDRQTRKQKSPGQSLVEFAILLPILLMMLSGLVEFGFMLNYYLDLIDTAREVARFAADDDPLHDEAGAFNSNPLNSPEPYGFYWRAQQLTDRSLNQAGQIELDPATDDMVISVFSVAGGLVTARFPPQDALGNGGEAGWMLYGNHASSFTSGDINTRLDVAAANTGIVLVELFYDYDMVLGLPWITVFVPEAITLHAYSIMPNTNAEPTPTPLVGP